MSSLATALATTGQLVAAAKTAESAAFTALNFEQFSDSALPYLIFSSLVAKTVASIPQAEHWAAKPFVYGGQTHSADYSVQQKQINPLETHLPNEKVWSVDSPQSYTTTSEDGNTIEKVTSIDFKTIDKDISSFVNLNKLVDTIKAGTLPTTQQFCLALLDIVDFIDFGIFGEGINRCRLEPFVQDRKITVKETVSTKTDSNVVSINKDVQQIGKQTVTNKQEIELSGHNLESRTIGREEYSTVQTRYSETKQSEQSIWERWLGGEVSSTHRIYDVIETTHKVDKAGADGVLKNITNDTVTRNEEIHKITSKDWKQGYVTYVPLAGTMVDIGRKYQLNVKVTSGDWIMLAIDTACVALMFVPMGQGAAVGRTGVAVSKVATAQGRKSLAKAALNPKGAAAKLRDYYSNPRAVFSPENIAAKTKNVAHNPMKGDMLKTLAQLSKLDKQGVNIRSTLRTAFADMGAEGKLIADTLTRNLRYLKQNGWLTPENVSRMSQGLNPWGSLKNLVAKPFRLDVDHIIPKSLAPELKAHPGNLVFLPQIDNILKSNNILRHVVQHVERFKEAIPHWKPATELLEKLKEFKMPHA